MIKIFLNNWRRILGKQGSAFWISFPYRPDHMCVSHESMLLYTNEGIGEWSNTKYLHTALIPSLSSWRLMTKWYITFLHIYFNASLYLSFSPCLSLIGPTFLSFRPFLFLRFLSLMSSHRSISTSSRCSRGSSKCSKRRNIICNSATCLLSYLNRVSSIDTNWRAIIQKCRLRPA